MEHHDSPSLEDLSLPSQLHRSLNGDTYERKAFLSPVRDYTSQPRKWSHSKAVHLILDLFLLTLVGILASSLWSQKSKVLQQDRVLGQDMHSFIPKEIGATLTPVLFGDTEGDPYWLGNDVFDNMTILHRSLAEWDKLWRYGYVLTGGDLQGSTQYPQRSALGDVFTVAAPHQVHCLGAILADNGAVRNGLPPTADVEHIIHCFNYIRQTLMCFADATTEGHGYESPDGSVMGVEHMCRDYSALRMWADEPSRVFPKDGKVQPY